MSSSELSRRSFLASHSKRLFQTVLNHFQRHKLPDLNDFYAISMRNLFFHAFLDQFILPSYPGDIEEAHGRAKTIHGTGKALKLKRLMLGLVRCTTNLPGNRKHGINYRPMALN